MHYFSEEYLESLQNEHKLIQASLNRIVNKRVHYLRGNNQMIIDRAHRELLTQKLILEVKIDELLDFLRS